MEAFAPISVFVSAFPLSITFVFNPFGKFAYAGSIIVCVLSYEFSEIPKPIDAPPRRYNGNSGIGYNDKPISKRILSRLTVY